MIDFGGSAINACRSFALEEEVVLAGKLLSGEVGLGAIELLGVDGDWIHAGGGNAIAGKGRAKELAGTGRVWGCGERVVNGAELAGGVKGFGEVTGFLFVCGEGHETLGGGELAAAFVDVKEEGFVLAVVDLGDDERAAEAGAVFVALEGAELAAAGVGEVAIGIHAAVAEEFEDAAVEGIGAGLGGDGEDAAAGAAVFGAVGVGLDTEFFDAFDGGDGAVGVHVGSVGIHRDGDAIHHDGVRGIATAIHGETSDGFEAFTDAAVTASGAEAHDARGERCETEDVASVEREVDDALVFNDAAKGGGGGVDELRAAADGDRFCECADLESDVDGSFLLRGNRNGFEDIGAETCFFSAHFVAARGEWCGKVEAALVGRDADVEISFDVSDDDTGTSNQRA